MSKAEHNEVGPAEDNGQENRTAGENGQETGTAGDNRQENRTAEDNGQETRTAGDNGQEIRTDVNSSNMTILNPVKEMRTTTGLEEAIDRDERKTLLHDAETGRLPSFKGTVALSRPFIYLLRKCQLNFGKTLWKGTDQIHTKPTKKRIVNDNETKRASS